MDSKTRTYKFALRIIEFMDKLPKDITTYIIGKQLLRAATSIGANIVEAQASSSRRDFTNFFSYSLKSANETKYWLELLRDSNKVGKDKIEPLITEVNAISRILGSSVLTLRGRNKF